MHVSDLEPNMNKIEAENVTKQTKHFVFHVHVLVVVHPGTQVDAGIVDVSVNSVGL